MTIELELLRLNLEQARQQLIDELERFETYCSSALEKLEAMKNRKRNSLSDIERALQKLNDGTYGFCDKCREPIERGRLEILPHASLCMACMNYEATSKK